MEEYLENLEHQLEVSPPEEDRVAIYQQMATIWEENFAKPDRAAEVLEKILLIDERNAKAYRDLERLYQQERKWEALVDTYRKHLGRHQRRGPSGSSSTPRWARSTRRSCAISIAPSRPTTTSSPSRPSTPRRWPALARLYEETEQWDRAVEVMRRLIRDQHRPEAEGRPQLPARARSSTSR